MADIAYLQEHRSLCPLTEQRALLQTAGVLEAAQVFTDPAPRRRSARRLLPQRDRAILLCAPGVRFWIATPAVLGVTTDALDALRRLSLQGAVLWVASTGRSYAWVPAAAPVTDLAGEIAAEAGARRSGAMSVAALAREARGRAANAAAWSEARAMWRDRRFTVEAIEGRTGLGKRALYHAVERGELPVRDAAEFARLARAVLPEAVASVS